MKGNFVAKHMYATSKPTVEPNKKADVDNDIRYQLSSDIDEATDEVDEFEDDRGYN